MHSCCILYGIDMAGHTGIQQYTLYFIRLCKILKLFTTHFVLFHAFPTTHRVLFEVIQQHITYNTLCSVIIDTIDSDYRYG